MKLSSKFTGDIVGVTIKRNKSQDGRDAFVDFDIGIDQAVAKEKWGDDFASLAFSTMRVIAPDPDGDDEEEGNHIGFLVDSVKPNKKFVFERHQVELEEERFECQPELLVIHMVDGAARVNARLRLPIDVGQTKLLSRLCEKVGKTVNVTFNPKQAGFEFAKAKPEALQSGIAAVAAR
jgi:hypothetical protein